MRLAIMQPYLFPYLGYFQLAASADRFVFYDDVAFIKTGWINRNRILLDGQPHYLTVPLISASSFRRIADIGIAPRARWLPKLLKLLHHAYSRAPHYAAVSRLVEQILSSGTESIAQIAARSVKETCSYLGIDITFVDTSIGYGNNTLTGQSRVLDICRVEHATTYVNLPGGRSLYDRSAFTNANIELAFIEPSLIPYPQFDAPFVPALSIIDALMFNRPESVRAMISSGAVST